MTPGAQYCTAIGQKKSTTCPASDDRLSSQARPVRSVETGGAQEVRSASVIRRVLTMVTLKGKSYRLRERAADMAPTA